MSNAAKYTPDGGRIQIVFEPDGTSGFATARVRDNGIGIAPDVLPHIFEIFVQSRDAAGRSHGGLGIGLNLVRRLVELHGGTVSASSRGQGQGSEFVVTLPVAKG